MARTNENKKRLHLARVPAYGTEVLTKCGRKRNINNTGFTNPNATLCEQCRNLCEAEGLEVTVTWVENPVGKDHWRVKATPPMIVKVGNVLIDRNDPEAKPVMLTVDKVMRAATAGMDTDQLLDWYESLHASENLVLG